MSSINTMISKPNILVQIVHLEGERKGEIDKFQQPVIRIGRALNSHIIFSASERIVSRKHAEIKREGNRFLLVNLSQNGCFVNRQQIEQRFLNQGDIITFSRKGPKISFLYTIDPQTGNPEIKYSKPAISGRPDLCHGVGESTKKAKGLYTIQFGTKIRSFKQHAIRLGKHPDNHFVLNHHAVLDMHSEIYFQNSHYYLRDKHQYQATWLNGNILTRDKQLYENDIIMFGDAGPQMQYLDDGLLVELVNPIPLQPSSASPRVSFPGTRQTPVYKATIGDLIKPLFRH